MLICHLYFLLVNCLFLREQVAWFSFWIKPSSILPTFFSPKINDPASSRLLSFGQALPQLLAPSSEPCLLSCLKIPLLQLPYMESTKLCLGKSTLKLFFCVHPWVSSSSLHRTPLFVFHQNMDIDSTSFWCVFCKFWSLGCGWLVEDALHGGQELGWMT